MPKTHMTDSEIAASFRTAKDKAAQVQVLAELNAVSPETMRAHLESLGLDVPAGKRRQQTPQAAPSAGVPLREFQSILNQFVDQYPDAAVRMPGGMLSGVTVTLSYSLAGDVAAAEICLNTGGKIRAK